MLALGVLAGCSSGSSGSTSTSGAKQGDGTVSGPGGDSIGGTQNELPKSFPKDAVPLPRGGSLQAVVSGSRNGNPYYSVTYSIDAADLKSAADDYRSRLKDAGFRIESTTSVGGSTASFSTFTAAGRDWYVIAYGGGGNQAAGTLSLQVTKQNPAPGASTTP